MTVDAATAAACVLALLAGMAALIKTMVLKRLDNIDGKLDGMDGRLQNVTGRVISLEEWRKNSALLGRRITDGCPHEDCPLDKTDPGITLTGSSAKSLRELLEAMKAQGGDR